MKKPVLAVDVVAIYRNEGIILVKRSHDPYKDHWAIPGGLVEYGETVENAAVREFKEETGLEVKLVKIVGVYSDPSRDPRGHVVSVAFLGIVRDGMLKPSEETKEVKIFKLHEIPHNLAFDHRKIIFDALKAMEVLGFV